MKPHSEIKADMVRQWLAKAEEDFLVAQHLLAGSLSLSAVGFHAQQAVEKALKAFLVYHQIEFPKTHDIDALLDLTAAIDKELSEMLSEASILTAYSVEARYPGDYPEITKADAAEAVSAATKALEAVRQRLAMA
jgi:HEPN domain-containing protein